MFVSIYCVVCIVCMDYAFPAFVTLHAVRDSQLPCAFFDRVGLVDFLPSLFLLDLSASFSPFFPSGHLVSFVRLPDGAAMFRLTPAFVLFRFFIPDFAIGKNLKQNDC